MKRRFFAFVLVLFLLSGCSHVGKAFVNSVAIPETKVKISGELVYAGMTFEQIEDKLGEPEDVRTGLGDTNKKLSLFNEPTTGVETQKTVITWVYSDQNDQYALQFEDGRLARIYTGKWAKTG